MKYGRYGRKTYYPHIYFESKRKGRDSVFQAVKDTGSPGVRSAQEVKMLVAALLADLADLKTRDHRGRVKRFTPGTWTGRMRVLSRLAKRYGGMRYVKALKGVYGEIARASPRKRREIIREILRKEFKLSSSKINELLRRVNR